MVSHRIPARVSFSLSSMRGTQKAPAFVLAWAVAVALSCSGCGSSVKTDLGQVQGTVTLDGSPLANAQVVFSPDGGRPSTGVTDDAGKYTLTYIRDTKGAKIGKHSVRIESVPPPSEPTAENPEGVGAFVEKIPAKYNAETQLTAEVKPGENTCDFQLVSK